MLLFLRGNDRWCTYPISSSSRTNTFELKPSPQLDQAFSSCLLGVVVRENDGDSQGSVVDEDEGDCGFLAFFEGVDFFGV